MISENLKVVVAIIVLILAIVTGFFVGRETSPVDTVLVGAETTLVTVEVQDTVIIEKITTDIRVVTKVKHDTLYLKEEAEEQKDSTICYEFEEVMEDSAYVKCGVCSDSLPKEIDLSGKITYLPPPKITTEIFRVDTVTEVNRDWKMFAVVGALSFVGGILISNR